METLIFKTYYNIQHCLYRTSFKVLNLFSNFLISNTRYYWTVPYGIQFIQPFFRLFASRLTIVKRNCFYLCSIKTWRTGNAFHREWLISPLKTVCRLSPQIAFIIVFLYVIKVEPTALRRSHIFFKTLSPNKIKPALSTRLLIIREYGGKGGGGWSGSVRTNLGTIPGIQLTIGRLPTFDVYSTPKRLG